MTRKQFEDWLEKLKVAWETRDPEAAANLCAEKVLYYETPFGRPLTQRKDVLKEWESVPGEQKDITFSYEILSLEDNFGIAHWSAKFTRLPSGKKAHLDGIFKISLNEKGLCTEFHQWWNGED